MAYTLCHGLTGDTSCAYLGAIQILGGLTGVNGRILPGASWAQPRGRAPAVSWKMGRVVERPFRVQALDLRAVSSQIVTRHTGSLSVDAPRLALKHQSVSALQIRRGLLGLINVTLGASAHTWSRRQTCLNALLNPQYTSIFIYSKFPPQHSSVFCFCFFVVFSLSPT